MFTIRAVHPVKGCPLIPAPVRSSYCSQKKPVLLYWPRTVCSILRRNWEYSRCARGTVAP